mmetsp:Transcript_14547/g.22761  ORF Transcript_14547/g.22761 Transcript_14547/m.22761 type:complete len:279 (+) Transcript_14547:75-911(+)
MRRKTVIIVLHTILNPRKRHTLHIKQQHPFKIKHILFRTRQRLALRHSRLRKLSMPALQQIIPHRHLLHHTKLPLTFIQRNNRFFRTAIQKLVIHHTKSVNLRIRPIRLQQHLRRAQKEAILDRHRLDRRHHHHIIAIIVTAKQPSLRRLDEEANTAIACVHVPCMHRLQDIGWIGDMHSDLGREHHRIRHIMVVAKQLDGRRLCRVVRIGRIQIFAKPRFIDHRFVAARDGDSSRCEAEEEHLLIHHHAHGIEHVHTSTRNVRSVQHQVLDGHVLVA